MSADLSFSGLLTTLQHLEEYCRVENITHIHAHPFYSFLVAALVAQRTHLPFFLTLHGPASIDGLKEPLPEMLFRGAVLPAAQRVLCVSEETKVLLQSISSTPCGVLPNRFTPSESYSPTSWAPGKPWLWAGRLDDPKLVGLVDLIDKIKGLEIELHIYGDGPSRSKLEDMRRDGEGDFDFVTLKGWQSDLPSIMGDYGVVAGMGRVILEAASLNTPSLLVGYDGVKGFVDRSLFETAAFSNFSGRNLPTIAHEEIRKLISRLPNTIADLQFGDWLSSENGEAQVWDQYTQVIGEDDRTDSPLLQAALDGLKVQGHSDKPVWQDRDYLDLLIGLFANRRVGDEWTIDIANTLNNARQQQRLAYLSDQLGQRSNELATAVRERDQAEFSRIESDRLRNEWEHRARAFANSTSWRITKPLRMMSTAGRMLTDGRTRARLQFIFDQLKRTGLISSAKLVWQRLGDSQAGSRGASTGHGEVEKIEVRPLQQETIFIFAGVPFDDVGGGQRSAQLARVFAKSGFKVYYIYAFPKFDFHKGIFVKSAVDIDNIHHYALSDISIEWLFSGCLNGSMCIFQIPHGEYLKFLRLANTHGIHTVFEMIDEWNTSLGGDWFSDEVLDGFLAEAERVTGTAKTLVEEMQADGRSDAEYLPNAANDTIFDHYREYPRPPEYDTDKRALLYYGSLYGEWFGWDYINAAASKHTDATIYLIGDGSPNTELEPNVRLLGPRQIDELPAYLKWADTALLPFIPGDISNAVSPIKIFEYIFMGKRVVSTSLPDIEGYPNVDIADSVNQFGDLCARQDAEASPPENFIAANSWQSRASCLLNIEENKRVSVIVLVHNNIKIIDRFIDSLKLNGKKHIKEIIVVDNASGDGSYDYVRTAHPDVVVLANDRNGCSSGRNLGIEHASGEVIAFFDSDQWFTSSLGFLEALRILDSRPDIGAVGWAAGWLEKTEWTSTLGGPIVDVLPARGTCCAEYRRYGFRTDVHYLGTGGLFLRREIFRRLSGFDEAYDPTCFEDTDLSFQIRRLGLRLAFRDLTGIRHQPHQTTGANSQSAAYRTLFERNSNYFKDRWADEIKTLSPVPIN